MSGCIEYQGYRNKEGYGRQYNPRTKRQAPAHRMVYEQYHGVVLPVDVVVRHTCDNPACINIEHLITGSQDENIQDKVDRNRQAVGSRLAAAKLTEADIPVIRKRLAAQETCAAIARDYGVSRPLIGYIKQGKMWRHV